MELNQLRQFAAIAETGNMTRAAELLFVSQPALSASIKKLEKELGCELFHRDRNGISMTEEGTRALEYTQRILTAADEMRDSFGSGQPLSITFYSASVSAVRYLIPRFIVTHPDAQVAYKYIQPAEIGQALLDKECDVTFSFSPVDNSAVNNMPFCQDCLMASLHQSHPLFEERQIMIRDLKGSQSIFPKDGQTQSKALRHLLKKYRIPFRELEDEQVYRSMLKISEYVGFVSSLALPYVEEIPGRKYVMLQDPELQMTVYISYLRKNGKKLEPFLSWIRENYQDLIR